MSMSTNKGERGALMIVIGLVLGAVGTIYAGKAKQASDTIQSSTGTSKSQAMSQVAVYATSAGMMLTGTAILFIFGLMVSTKRVRNTMRQ